MADSSGERYGPSVWQTIDESLASLRVLKRRSVLALLGIAVGCASVVALLNIGHNAANEAIKAFQGLGTNTLLVSLSVKSDTTRKAPAVLDTRALRVANPRLSAVSPFVFFPIKARQGSFSSDGLVVGTTPDLASVLDLQLRSGRWLSEFDDQATFVVVGAGIARDLYIKPGDRLQLDGYLYQVVGVLRHQLANPMLPVSPDSAILLPIQGMKRVMPAPEISTIIAKTSSSNDIEIAAATLSHYLAEAIPSHTPNAQVPQHLLDGLKKQTDTFAYLLAALGAVALLVGGVGIMNIMLSNVTERRREIGIRTAIGATRRDIRNLFLIEAITLSIVGALAGALAGVLAAYLFAKGSGWTFSLSLISIPLGIVSSIAIGVMFGIHPALTAARMQPVQALRDE